MDFGVAIQIYLQAEQNLALACRPADDPYMYPRFFGPISSFFGHLPETVHLINESVLDFASGAHPLALVRYKLTLRSKFVQS